jgi:hypothetical protein
MQQAARRSTRVLTLRAAKDSTAISRRAVRNSIQGRNPQHGTDAEGSVSSIATGKVRDKLPLVYERDDIPLTMIQQRGDAERLSSRNMRSPLQIRPGGKAGPANMDGGDLRRGSGTIYDVAQVTPVFFDTRWKSRN